MRLRFAIARHVGHRCGSFCRPLLAKNDCSPAENVKCSPQSRQVKIRSRYTLCPSTRRQGRRCTGLPGRRIDRGRWDARARGSDAREAVARRDRSVRLTGLLLPDYTHQCNPFRVEKLAACEHFPRISLELCGRLEEHRSDERSESTATRAIHRGVDTSVATFRMRRWALTALISDEDGRVPRRAA
jgi:hypothetical protein